MAQAFLIVLAILGFLLLLAYVARRQAARGQKYSDTSDPVNAKKLKLMTILRHVQEKGRITNDETERLVGVSDATATRYLEELEKEGKLEQVGAVGRGVYYRLKQ